MKRIRLLLSCALLAMILCTGIGTAWAYFTTYAPAKGGYPIHLGANTEIKEEPEFSNYTKHVVIQSEAGSEPVYVRVKGFSGDDGDLSYSGSGWLSAPDSDGFYRYDGILDGGGKTPELNVTISKDSFPEDAEEGDSFNVVVVYETMPVQYRTNGDVVPVSEIAWHTGGGDQ